MNKLEELIENHIEYFRPGYILTDRERKKVMEGLKITCDESIGLEPITNTEPMRHGEWIVDKQNGEYARCSLCNGTTGTQWDGVEPIPLLTAYCPHCGAYMKGDKSRNMTEHEQEVYDNILKENAKKTGVTMF